MKIPKVKNVINNRIEELKGMKDNLQSKERIFEEYSNRILLKKLLIEKKKREIEFIENEYLLRYQVFINF